MTDFMIYFGLFCFCEGTTTYARIVYASYLLETTLKIRNFTMFVFTN
jgi:hypothetical protein